MSDLRPRRSVLYMPAANERALEKAKTLPADAIIFDLEDAVAPDAKETARPNAVAAAGSAELRSANSPRHATPNSPISSITPARVAGPALKAGTAAKPTAARKHSTASAVIGSKRRAARSCVLGLAMGRSRLISNGEACASGESVTQCSHISQWWRAFAATLALLCMMKPISLATAS